MGVTQRIGCNGPRFGPTHLTSFSTTLVVPGGIPQVAGWPYPRLEELVDLDHEVGERMAVGAVEGDLQSSKHGLGSEPVFVRYVGDLDSGLVRFPCSDPGQVLTGLLNLGQYWR